MIALIGVATFYGQNSFVKKNIVTTSSSKEAPRKDNNNNGAQPINEEETKHGNVSDGRQSNDERAIHELFITSLFVRNTKTDFTNLYHQVDFKEIHFEVITPPPDVV
jgi:hypothetical protein